MSKSSNVLQMQQAVIDFIKSSIPKDINKAHLGRVSGDRVIIGNRSYPFIPTVDTYFSDGDSVYCVLPDSGNTAAIVGVR